jgi:hypothetical protein
VSLRHRGHRLIPYAFALTASVVFFVSITIRGQGAALASPPPLPARLLKAMSGASCPLSASKQLQAANAFRDMMPVFRHPRCFNCHGGFDIRSEQHEGSDVAKESGLDPRGLLTVNERKRLHEGCGSCHDNITGSLKRLDGTTLSGWLVAPKPMLWDGKDDEELCMQMKRFEQTGAAFVDHLTTDHEEVKFIEASFRGDRALGTALEGAPAPPPGTQADLIAKAKKWVTLVGAGYTASPECGCSKPKIELTMTTKVSGTSEGQVMTGAASATVALTADSTDLVYRGEAPLVHGQYTVPPLPPGCKVKIVPAGGSLVVKEARFDVRDDGRSTIALLVNPTNSSGTWNVSCPGLPNSLTTPLMQVAQQWRFVHEPDRKNLDYRFDDFETPTERSSEGGRILLGRKEVTRTTQREGVTVSAKTVFEFWSVPNQSK